RRGLVDDPDRALHVAAVTLHELGDTLARQLDDLAAQADRLPDSGGHGRPSIVAWSHRAQRQPSTRALDGERERLPLRVADPGPDLVRRDRTAVDRHDPVALLQPCAGRRVVLE